VTVSSFSTGCDNTLA